MYKLPGCSALFARTGHSFTSNLLGARHLTRAHTFQHNTLRASIHTTETQRYESKTTNPEAKSFESKLLETASDIETALSNPQWSINSLLPSTTDTTKLNHAGLNATETDTRETGTNEIDTKEITPDKLHHLLRLCALPPPENQAEEEKMLSDLKAQLHFVRSIQSVNTKDVAPLTAIRDETDAARKENEISLELLRSALDKETVLGKHHRRIRRTKADRIVSRAEEWDVLGQAPKKVGRYFVVEGKDS